MRKFRADRQAITEAGVDHAQLGIVPDAPGDEVDDTERVAVLRRRLQQHRRALARLKVIPEFSQLYR